MNSKAGIWIDRNKAIIVHLGQGHERVIHIASQLPAHQASIYEQQFLHEDKNTLNAQREAKFKSQLHKFYKKVAFAVEDAEGIFIFGPDMARIDLKKEMKKVKDRHERIRGVERADEMTEEQIIQKVMSYFKTYPISKKG